MNIYDGTLGVWNDEPYNIELKEGAKPYHTSEAVIMKFCSKKDEANYELFPTKKTRSRPRCNARQT